LRSAAASKPLCAPHSQFALDANPKEALRELSLWLRNLVSVPPLWAACIRKLSNTDIEICPRLPSMISAFRGAHNGGTEGDMDPSQDAQREERRLCPPSLACVPLAVSSARGEAMSVGVLVTSKRLSHVGEAIFLGVEFVSPKGTCTPVYFSPVSGRVFVRFSGHHEGLVSQPLPALDASSAADLQGLEAFFVVGKSGYLSFGRRRGPGEDVEWTGEIEPEFLPPWAETYFASLTIQVDKLNGPAQVSITWAGDSPPASVAHAGSLETFNAVWGVHEW